MMSVSTPDPSVKLADSNATSLSTYKTNQTPLSMGRLASESFFEDPNTLTQPRKKPRLDSKQNNALQQQISHQWLQRQNILVLQQQQSQKLQLQLLIQQQKLRQHQQYLQSLSPLQRVQLCSGPRPLETSVCDRRLKQYLYHQRQRPCEKSIVYWRKFVKEYYSPSAKKRLCLSHYDSIVSPQTAMDKWQCDLCGCKSGKGFEATFGALARLNEIKYGSGLLDEILYVGRPSELKFGCGIMVLEYEKAVEENVYTHIRIVREGHLRIVFSQQLKILSWEFCSRRHPINQSGIQQQESNSLNKLGFPKQYLRSLQTSEFVSSMKDLIDLCHHQKVGPIEALKRYSSQKKSDKVQMEANAASELPPHTNTPNNLMKQNHLNSNLQESNQSPSINNEGSGKKHN